MHAELIAYTQPNPALTPAAVAGHGDLATLAAGHGTYAEQLIEYAGRVCYRSTQRMGTAPEFISARVREGHEDIIEHIAATVAVAGSDEPLRWRLVNRHCEVSELGDGRWLVSGNTRVWLDFFRRGLALPALPLVAPIAPKVFVEFEQAASAGGQGAVAALSEPDLPIAGSPDRAALLPAEDGPMRVTLLGFTQPGLDDSRLAVDHGTATFLFEGISRTCTHQLVRHRLASFSQESQRYVDLSRGGWRAVVPPKVAENPAAMAVLAEFWQDAEEKYARLRELGIRKEDARFLLPNAAETRIVTSMNFAAWSHFLWLRALDTAAQWEIRAMGQRVLEMLYAIAPAVFHQHWQVYRSQIDDKPQP